MGLTVVSIVLGVVAQVRESAENAAQSARAQTEMLAILERTEKSVPELS